MKTRKIIIALASLGAAINISSITTLLTTCSKVKIYPLYKSIFNIDNKKFLYVKNHNLGTDIKNIKLFDSNNNEILFNKDNSFINLFELSIPLDNSNNYLNQYILKNINSDQTIIIKANNTKTFNKYNLKHDQNYFFNLLKDMSKNNIPTVGLVGGPALINQQSFYIALTNYFNNKNIPYSKDQVFLFARNFLWNEKRFNPEILIKNNIWDGNFDLSTFNNTSIFSNFNLYEDTIHIYDNTKIMKEYLYSILKKTNNLYFDFFHDDVEFVNNLENFNQEYFEYLFKYSNRIVILSDGAYHSKNTIPKLYNLLKNHNPKTKEETINILNKFRNGEINHLSKNDVLDIILLKKYESINPDSKFDYVSFINYDSNLFNAIDLNDNLIFHDSAFSTNFVDYQECIYDVNLKNEFLDVYSKLFINNDLNNQNIFSNGYEKYDPKKPNAVFLGSSLFRPLNNAPVTPDNFSRLTMMPKILNEVRTTIKKFFKKYDPNKYNIIFKLHPVFSNKDDPNNIAAKNYVKLISGIENPIIIDSSIPLESLISFDYYRYKYPDPNKKYESIFFKNGTIYERERERETLNLMSEQLFLVYSLPLQLFIQPDYFINQHLI